MQFILFTLHFPAKLQEMQEDTCALLVQKERNAGNDARASAMSPGYIIGKNIFRTIHSLDGQTRRGYNASIVPGESLYRRERKTAGRSRRHH